jgi:hypothetical protein
MKFRVAFIIVATTILSCSQPSNSDTEASADGTDTLTSDPVEDMSEASEEGSGEDPGAPPVKIGYSWGEGYPNPAVIFEPFEKIYGDVKNIWRIRDSLYNLRQGGPLNANDSASFAVPVEEAYASILRYQEQMKPGVRPEKGKAPQRVDVMTSEDQSFELLRESQSKILNSVDFMFLGGDPFVRQDPEVYKDAAGNPETHYFLQEPENSTYFFNYIYSRHPGPMDITFGPPLSGYEYDIEVHGIGSINHHLKNRITVWMLTNEGIFPADLISVNMKLGQEYGCQSNRPTYLIACSKNIDATSVFGVFFSDQELPMEKGVSRHAENDPLWEFDIDGDGSIDLVRVESLDYGGAGDLAIAIWYVRINDEWKVLDYAVQPDCT